MKKVQFYYVRHGETLFNAIGRSQGWCDSPLTENGIQQAYRCAEKLKDIHFDHAYTSSAERAYDTAMIVLRDRDIPLVRNKGLREMFFGTLEGSSFENDGPAQMECWKKKDFTEYGGECRSIFTERIRTTYEEIVNQCGNGDTVLITAHRGYFYYMLEALFGYNLDDLEREDPDILEHLIPNASSAEFTYTDGVWELVKMPE